MFNSRSPLNRFHNSYRYQRALTRKVRPTRPQPPTTPTL